MKTVMILGAGVARATVNQNCPVKRRPPLDADFFQVARAGRYAEYEQIIECLENLVGDYSATLMRSLETATSYLYLKAIDAEPRSKYHTGFITLLKLLNSVLAETTNNLKFRKRSLIYRFLLSELKKLESPLDLSIITFNYDLLLENTLQEIANSRPDVFNFPRCYGIDDYVGIHGVKGEPKFIISKGEFYGVRLLKLHGSMNWQSRHTSNIPTPKALFRPDRRLRIMNSRHIASSLIWKTSQRRFYMKPIIIPPISGKRSMMHNSMTKLWDLAAQKLQNADRIVIAGYSCPPIDFEARILISENLRLNSEKRVYVIDPKPKSAAKFLHLCGVTHTTIYSSISNWIDDATST